jgi:hypothetical protein
LLQALPEMNGTTIPRGSARKLGVQANSLRKKPANHARLFPPERGASLLNEPNLGEIVEFGTVGHEEVVGLLLMLGNDTIPSRAFIQIPKEGLRMRCRLNCNAQQLVCHATRAGLGDA